MSTNFKSLLTSIRSMVLKLLPAYKLFTGRKAETTTVKICEGTLQTDGSLTMLDDSFSGFVEGETYDVVLNGQSFKITASQIGEGLIGIADLTDVANRNYYAVGFVNGSIVCMAEGMYENASISISKTTTITEERYDIKKLPVECLPNTVASKTDVNEARAIAIEANHQAIITASKFDALKDEIKIAHVECTGKSPEITFAEARNLVIQGYLIIVRVRPNATSATYCLYLFGLNGASNRSIQGFSLNEDVLRPATWTNGNEIHCPDNDENVPYRTFCYMGEPMTDGSLIMWNTSGSKKYKISIDDSGALTTSEITE